VDALVADGALERLRVEDGDAAVVVPAGVELDLPASSSAVLLSPFYYVLPLLWRDRIVGRADLKSERATGTLRLKQFHREPRVRASAALDDALDRALDRLRAAAGLEQVAR
jgi:hypothetical protein